DAARQHAGCIRPVSCPSTRFVALCVTHCDSGSRLSTQHINGSLGCFISLEFDGLTTPFLLISKGWTGCERCRHTIPGRVPIGEFQFLTDIPSHLAWFLIGLLHLLRDVSIPNGHPQPFSRGVITDSSSS